MKNFLTRILLAAALTLVAFALVSAAQAQQADEDRAPAAPRQPQPTATPKSPQQPQVPATPSSAEAQTNDAQTQQALAFTGRIANEEGKLVLKDPVTKMSYQLTDQSKAKPYFGKQVKVVGRLETKSDTIHIETIEPI